MARAPGRRAVARPQCRRACARNRHVREGVPSMDAVDANLAAVHARIAAAAERAGRSPAAVTLIAVSKTNPAERVHEAPSLHFALLREIARRNGVDGLSMGMSADYETAIRFGATHVRVGTAIFGARQPVQAAAEG